MPAGFEPPEPLESEFDAITGHHAPQQPAHKISGQSVLRECVEHEKKTSFFICKNTAHLISTFIFARVIISTIPFILNKKISRFLPSSLAIQARLYQTWPDNPRQFELLITKGQSLGGYKMSQRAPIENYQTQP